MVIALLAACSGELEGEPFDNDGDGGGAFGGGGEDGGPGGMVAQSGGSGGTAGSGGQDNQGLGGTPAGQGGHGGNAIDPPAGTIPMFVAQGEAGRTLVSCDDGRSWVADQSDHGWQYCNSNDCDHDSGAGRGVIWADGWFVLTFGWGATGSIRRSRDGVTWESVLDGEVFGGIAFGNGRLVAAHKYGRYSDDLGETWNEAGIASVSGKNVRAAAFVPHGQGLFLIAASSSSTSEIVYGTDGIHFQVPESLPMSCAERVRLPGRIAYGNGTIVTVGDDGVVCRSIDGGRTWTARSISNRLRGGGVWTGSEFMTWDRGTVFRSTDGDTWTRTDTVPSDVDVGVVAISDSGTFASITAGYKQEYEGQRAYRSEDGIQWEVLSDDAFSQGHPMRAMTFGYGLPSAECP
jgi:hypothetical protein